MARIVRLDAHLTNMIAAGEVVERPMGIIKELVENAIDAKASRIEINVTEGGLRQIDILDNGHGMDSEDVSLAFERHATSKIKSTQDLWAIHTLGFRGEALPSIASVSQLVMLSNDGSESTRIEIHYGQTIKVTPFAANQGTQITVSGLFQKTPARLKHLKTVQYENSLISDVVQKFAMSYPAIAFRLIADGRETFKTSGSGDLLEVIYAIYGRDIAKNAMQIEGHDYDYHLEGAAILPQFTRASRNYINIFVNNRMIRSYRIQKAIMDSYHDYIPEDRYPIVVLNIKMDSQLVDVNVHPSKWEIRLSKEQQLEYLVRETLQEALRNYRSAPEISSVSKPKEKVEFSQLFSDPIADDQVIASIKQALSESTGQKNRSLIIESDPDKEVIEEQSFKKQEMTNTENYPTEPAEVKDQVQEEPPVSYALKKQFPHLVALSQLHGKYILAEGEAGLYIIDQHAAQERVHFEQFTERFLQKEPSMNDLLVPIMLEISTSLLDRIEEIIEVFQNIHIEVEMFGHNNLIVRRVPVWMKQVDEQAFLQDVMDLWKEEKDISLKHLQKDQLASMACHHSIRFNRVLTMQEMQQVIEDLALCQQPYHCPHGRPTFICISEKQLIKEFYR